MTQDNDTITDDPLAKNTNKSKMIIGGVILAVGLGGFIAYKYLKSPPPQLQIQTKTDPVKQKILTDNGINLNSIKDNAIDNMAKVSNIEQDTKDNTQKIKTLEDNLKKEQENFKLFRDDAYNTFQKMMADKDKATNNNSKPAKKNNQGIMDLSNIDNLDYIGNQTKPQTAIFNNVQNSPNNAINDPFAPPNSNSNNVLNTPIPQAKPVAVIADLLPENTDNQELDLRDVKKYLPAGAFASAKVLIGADASVGVANQADPLHCQFRVTSPAVSAIGKGDKTQITDIEGCIITAQCRGDLSSEKVYARLQTMTCSPKDGYVVEIPVQGGAVGRGKSGIRGPVISREGSLITQAFFADLIGGIGKATATATQQTGSGLTISGGNLTTTGSTSSFTDKLQAQGIQGLGAGFESSTRRIADYLIKRAEQYQPVVELASGRDVELVFYPKGTFIDGRKTQPQNTSAPLPNVNANLQLPLGNLNLQTNNNNNR